MKLRVLDLFSGIGGFSLGLERTGGFETVAFCEIEKYPQKVLAKHWPGVPIYDDVRTLTAERLAGDGIGRIDVITGGFPCQDISVAGKQAGMGEGTRSGLWSEIARLIGELRPRYAIMENVTALLSGDSGRWFGRVLGDLAEVGYDCEWHCIPASYAGRMHSRDRVWIVTYPAGVYVQKSQMVGAGQVIRKPRGVSNVSEICPFEGQADQPSMVGMVYGLSEWVDRSKALGNAVVPQIPELIGRAIMEHQCVNG